VAHPVTNTVSRYSIDGNYWSAVAPMATQRSDHTTTELGGELYVAGGCDGAQAQSCPSVTTVFEKYNPQTNTWLTLPPLPRPRYRHAAVAIGSRIYLVGGVDLVTPAAGYYNNLVAAVDVFDTTTNAWLPVGSVPPPLPVANLRVDLAAFARGSAIHVLGGYDPQGSFASSSAHATFGVASRTSLSCLLPRSSFLLRLYSVAGASAS
jgi:N-acetylneuraminic acid mutarotase